MSSHTKSFLAAIAESMNLTEPAHFEGPSKVCGPYTNTTPAYPTKCLVYGGNYDWQMPHKQLDQYYRTTIIFLGASSTEGWDRKTLGFGTTSEEMVKKFAM